MEKLPAVTMSKYAFFGQTSSISRFGVNESAPLAFVTPSTPCSIVCVYLINHYILYYPSLPLFSKTTTFSLLTFNEDDLAAKMLYINPVPCWK